MKFKKLFLISTILVGGLLSACGGSTDKTGGTGEAANQGTPATKELKLAHNLNEDHSVHKAIVAFADKVAEKTNGTVKVTIYPNGQLGSEGEVLEQLQSGTVAMTKVAANSLSTYEDGYNAFTLPYVFKDQEHFYKSMESDAVKELYNSTKEKGFIGLTYYTSGARSFYTKNKPINTLEDLKGLKIRVQDSPSQVDMMNALGASPVTMPYGDVYTALQSGVIDGAESNETALTNGKHGEVCKFFSYDEHSRIPDIVVISSKVWDGLNDEEKVAVEAAAKESTETHKGLWETAITEGVKEAQDTMKVAFNDVDKAAFVTATESVREKYSSQYPLVKKLLDSFATIQ